MSLLREIDSDTGHAAAVIPYLLIRGTIAGSAG